jgi:hypothetical protein
MFDLLTRERATNLVWTDEAHNLIGQKVKRRRISLYFGSVHQINSIYA